jgi:hypothetical protein
MDALLLTPKTQEDFDLLQRIAQKMKVKFSVLSEEDKEDYALAKAMLSVEDDGKVPDEEILLKLKK